MFTSYTRCVVESKICFISRCMMSEPFLSTFNVRKLLQRQRPWITLKCVAQNFWIGSLRTLVTNIWCWIRHICVALCFFLVTFQIGFHSRPCLAKFTSLLWAEDEHGRTLLQMAVNSMSTVPMKAVKHGIPVAMLSWRHSWRLKWERNSSREPNAWSSHLRKSNLQRSNAMQQESPLAPLSAQEVCSGLPTCQHSCMGRSSVISCASLLGRAGGS